MNDLRQIGLLFRDDESSITLCFSTINQQFVCLKTSVLYNDQRNFQRIANIHQTISQAAFVVRCFGSSDATPTTPVYFMLEYIFDCLPMMYQPTQMSRRFSRCQRSQNGNSSSSCPCTDSIQRLKLLRLIASQICQALEFIHFHGVWHRNITLANILFDCLNSRAVLIDFDDALLIGATNDDDSHREEANQIVGNLLFAAPEVPYDSKADIFALGMCLTTIYCQFGDSLFHIDK